MLFAYKAKRNDCSFELASEIEEGKMPQNTFDEILMSYELLNFRRQIWRSRFRLQIEQVRNQWDSFSAGQTFQRQKIDQPWGADKQQKLQTMEILSIVPED